MSDNQSNQSNVTNFYKNFNLKESKVFCLAPWVHLHTTPEGIAAPCCIANSTSDNQGMGNSRTQPLMDLVNSEKMKKLRVDMLTNVENNECVKCYQHDKQNVASARAYFNTEYNEFYDEVMENTELDGTLTDFRMRYFDIRFNNICNFKCRTCGSGFSSQWEQEDLKANVGYARIIPKNDNPNFLEDVKNQLPNLKNAYFAGGEPLITEEHYVLLEEMIRRGKTHARLRYNTNMSNLKFKNKDLMGLWSKFDYPIEIFASIDHYGERAEYIRHGTDWGLVESNLIRAKKTPFIKLKMNTVLSAFNFCTIGEFYQYLIDKNLFSPHDELYTIYNMSVPEHFTSHILPEKQKEIGRKSMEKIVSVLGNKNFKQDQIKQFTDALPWALLYNTWEQHRYAFVKEVQRIDKLRNEDFQKTFPELAELLDRPVI